VFKKYGEGPINKKEVDPLPSTISTTPALGINPLALLRFEFKYKLTNVSTNKEGGK
jgi:hypothetical protein